MSVVGGKVTGWTYEKDRKETTRKEEKEIKMWQG
jgi:hypothetical protein